MSKNADRRAVAFRRCLSFVDRPLVWCSKNMGVCAVVVSIVGLILCFAGLAKSLSWGSAQLGPVSSYLAAAATVGAVTVALRQSAQARKLSDDALLAAKARAEIDREFTHRRETTNQIIQMWTEIGNIEPLFLVHGADRLSTTVDKIDSYTKFIMAMHSASSAVFAAQAITLHPKVIAAIKDLQEKLAKFQELAMIADSDVDEWIEKTTDAWSDVTDIRTTFPELLREHLPLLESVEEENKRLQQLRDAPSLRGTRMNRILTEFFGLNPSSRSFELLKDVERE